MYTELKALIEQLNAREERAYARAEKKRELGNPVEASKQDGKFIAYRYAREALEDIVSRLEMEEEQACAEALFDDYDEVGYDPYSGCYCDDL